MHSVSVCPSLSETVCAHAFCMWLHCFDMLLGPYLQMKTASSWSRVGVAAPRAFLTSNTCSVFFPNHIGEKISISLDDGPSIFLEEPGMHVNDGRMSWIGACISHLSSRDIHGVLL